MGLQLDENGAIAIGLRYHAEDGTGNLTKRCRGQQNGHRVRHERTCRNAEMCVKTRFLRKLNYYMPRFQKRYLILVIVLVVIGICLGIFQLVQRYSEEGDFGAGASDEELMPPDPMQQLPSSPSVLRAFRKAAVCTDGPPCSEIGRDILSRGGSAVDAALASCFCNGIVNQQSMGLGGGFLMTVYTRATGEAVTLNAREVAPARAHKDMYMNIHQKSHKGPLWIGVPGELLGYWEAHKRFGVLPWREIVQPVIQLCENGYNMSRAQFGALEWNQQVKEDKVISSVFVDPLTGNFLPIGSFVRPHPVTCETLRTIAEEGGEALNTGSLARKLAEDLKEMGSIITEEDLANYKPRWMPALNFSLRTGHDPLSLLTVPAPGSGVLLGFIFNVLRGYNLRAEDNSDVESRVLTMHRIVEAFKHAYARRTELGDPEFVDITELMKNLTSYEYAEGIRRTINDNHTSTDPKHYGAAFYNQPDHGTAHISVLAPNGDAVSITSTINYYFGSGLSSRQTGIVLNNCMDDFSVPGLLNYFNIPASPANVIEPGKRPLSSMSPSVVVDRSGEVRMVVGASGGTKITTAVALVMLRHLWFGQTIKQAVDAPRFHHQLYPMQISYEYGILNQLIKGLQEKGHQTNRYRDRGSIICAMSVNSSGIFANADYRKGGDVFGL